MQNDLLDVYVMIGRDIMITHGPCAGSHARIIGVEQQRNIIKRYVVEIATNANDNNQVTILSREEFEINEET